MPDTDCRKFKDSVSFSKEGLTFSKMPAERPDSADISDEANSSIEL